MTKRITLTRKGFREWLVGKPGEEVIGRTECMTVCPMAQYLRHLGAPAPTVTPLRFQWRRYDPGAVMPLWAERFVCTIDRHFKNKKLVTARQALTVLDGKEAK